MNTDTRTEDTRSRGTIRTWFHRLYAAMLRNTRAAVTRDRTPIHAPDFEERMRHVTGRLDKAARHSFHPVDNQNG